MMEIGQLVVRFERDGEPRLYPYLGQACLMGVAHSLLQGYDCKRPVEFSPRYGNAAAQIKLGEVLHVDRNAVDPFEELAAWTPTPFWVLPSEGWRTARCLQAALASGGAIIAGVLDIIGPLSTEIDDWVERMDAAVNADIRFQVDVEACPEPPADLVLFVDRDFAETAALIRQALEEAGIEITEKEGMSNE